MKDWLKREMKSFQWEWVLHVAYTFLAVSVSLFCIMQASMKGAGA